MAATLYRSSINPLFSISLTTQRCIDAMVSTCHLEPIEFYTWRRACEVLRSLKEVKKNRTSKGKTNRVGEDRSAKNRKLRERSETVLRFNPFSDKKENNMANKVSESSNEKVDMKDALRHEPDMSKNVLEINKVNTKGESCLPENNNSEEVNMEASITSDDVNRAGGFGARDDMSSFLPVAIDATDFEASLRDARDYEEPQGKIDRPGLGWKEAME